MKGGVQCPYCRREYKIDPGDPNLKIDCLCGAYSIGIEHYRDLFLSSIVILSCIESIEIDGERESDDPDRVVFKCGGDSVVWIRIYDRMYLGFTKYRGVGADPPGQA